MKNNHDNDEKGKRGKIFQSAVYGLGVVLVALTFYQFWYTSQIQTDITSYENRLNSASLMRDDLVDIMYSFNAATSELLEIDAMVGIQFDLGLITEEEANATILIYRFKVFAPLGLILTKLLIWDPNVTTPTGTGGLVTNPEFEWVFTEEVIWVAWLEKYYDTIAIVDDRYSKWHNIKFDDFFRYTHTYALVTEGQPGWAIHDLVDRSVNWFYWDIALYTFDDYVQKNMLDPKLNLANQLSLLEIAITANTIGVLLLGFIIDFGLIGRKWKSFYIFLALSTIFASLMFTVGILI